MIRSYARFMLLAAVMLLSACSYFEPAEPIDVTNADAAQTIDPIQTFETRTAGYEDNVRARSNGSVEVYGFDSTGNPYTPSREPGLQPSSAQTRPASDPSVEIYPLDDAMARRLDAIPSNSRPAAPTAKIEQPETLDSFEEQPPVSLQGFPQDPTTLAVNTPPPNLTAVYFDHGSAEIDSSGINTLDAIADTFNPALGIGLEIVGHASTDSEITDPISRKVTNLKESMNRAFNVAAILIKQGVPPEALRVTGMGETLPVRGPNPYNDSSTARRVEIYNALP